MPCRSSRRIDDRRRHRVARQSRADRARRWLLLVANQSRPSVPATAVGSGRSWAPSPRGRRGNRSARCPPGRPESRSDVFDLDRRDACDPDRTVEPEPQRPASRRCLTFPRTPSRSRRRRGGIDRLTSNASPNSPPTQSCSPLHVDSEHIADAQAVLVGTEADVVTLEHRDTVRRVTEPGASGVVGRQDHGRLARQARPIAERHPAPTESSGTRRFARWRSSRSPAVVVRGGLQADVVHVRQGHRTNRPRSDRQSPNGPAHPGHAGDDLDRRSSTGRGTCGNSADAVAEAEQRRPAQTDPDRAGIRRRERDVRLQARPARRGSAWHGGSDPARRSCRSTRCLRGPRATSPRRPTRGPRSVVPTLAAGRDRAKEAAESARSLHCQGGRTTAHCVGGSEWPSIRRGRSADPPSYSPADAETTCKATRPANEPEIVPYGRFRRDSCRSWSPLDEVSGRSDALEASRAVARRKTPAPAET